MNSRRLLPTVPAGPGGPAETSSELAVVVAVPMFYDDSSRRWVPCAGGGAGESGPASIHLLKERTSIRVWGQRVYDQQTVLECHLSQATRFHRATATFLQWRSEGRVFGLSFTSEDDANLFTNAMTWGAEALSVGDAGGGGPPQSPDRDEAESGGDSLYESLDSYQDTDKSFPGRNGASTLAHTAAPMCGTGPQGARSPSEGTHPGGAPPPPPPPPPPAGGSAAPRPPAFGASIAGVQLKKVQPTEESGPGGGGGSRGPSGGGGSGGGLMDEMSAMLARRRKTSQGVLSAATGTPGTPDPAPGPEETPAAFAGPKKDTRPLDSPKKAPWASGKPLSRSQSKLEMGHEAMRKEPGPCLNSSSSLSRLEMSRGAEKKQPDAALNSSRSLSRTKSCVGSLTLHAVPDGSPSQNLKEEILAGVRLELHQVKEEILAAVRQELTRFSKA